MCLSPKYITNRTLHFNLFQPLKISVPCGKCEECKNQIRNEWFTRCYFEWQRHRQSTYFYTLTYNNAHVPMFNGFTCFRKKDLQDFLKRLRFWLYKQGITFKYLISCEYGEKFNRSHYHVLFFLSKQINSYRFYALVEKSWQKGFVKYGDNAGLVNSANGIQYVTKYVTKDFIHLRNILKPLSKLVFSRYYKLFHYVCRRRGLYPPCCFVMNDDCSFSRKIFGNCSDDDLEFLQKFLTKMRHEVNRFIPFHIQSTKLGSNIVERCDKDLERCFVMRPNGKATPAQLPRYIKRMLWYDVVESETTGKNSRFVLNDEGKKHLLKKISISVQNDVDEYRTILMNISSCPDDVINYFGKLDRSFGFQHVRDIIFYAQHFDLDLEVLAIYKQVFRGRLNMYNITGLTSQYVKDSYIDILEYSLYAIPNMDFGIIFKDSKLVANLSTMLWNLDPYFQPYEEALQILEAVKIYRSTLACNAKLEQDEKSRKLREFIKNY